MNRKTRWILIALGAALLFIGLLLLSIVLTPIGDAIQHDITPLAPTLFSPPGG